MREFLTPEVRKNALFPLKWIPKYVLMKYIVVTVTYWEPRNRWTLGLASYDKQNLSAMKYEIKYKSIAKNSLVICTYRFHRLQAVCPSDVKYSCSSLVTRAPSRNVR